MIALAPVALGGALVAVYVASIVRRESSWAHYDLYALAIAACLVIAALACVGAELIRSTDRWRSSAIFAAPFLAMAVYPLVYFAYAFVPAAMLAGAWSLRGARRPLAAAVGGIAVGLAVMLLAGVLQQPATVTCGVAGHSTARGYFAGTPSVMGDVYRRPDVSLGSIDEGATVVTFECAAGRIARFTRSPK